MLAAAATSAIAPAAQAATVFSDTFGTSTLNSATPAAPTGAATNYQVLSSKNATGSSIVPGSLQLNMGATTSGLAEIEAPFAAAPVNLASPGDFVKLQMTFTASGINLSGAGTLNVGLFNSGGTGPVPGTNLNNAQLDDDPGTFNSGNAAGWLGYVSRIPIEGTGSVIYTRPAQVGETSNEAQDALFSNAAGGAFDNPTGSNVATAGTGETLAAATIYTLTMQIVNNGAGGLDISFDLDDPSVAGIEASLAGTHAAPVTTAFDSLAFGYRGVNNVAPGHSLNVSSILVESNAAVPEPTSVGLVGAAASGILARRRRRK